MKVAIVLTFLLVASFASSFDEVKALVQNDLCAESSLELIKPQVHEQIQKLKQVTSLIYSRTQKTSLPRLNFWASFKRPRISLTNVELTKRSNQFWVMPLKLPVWDSSSPQTASRMSEPFSSSPIQSSKTHLMLPTTSSSSFSSLFWEDKLMLIAHNSSDSFFDLFIEYHSFIHFSMHTLKKHLNLKFFLQMPNYQAD